MCVVVWHGQVYVHMHVCMYVGKLRAPRLLLMRIDRLWSGSRRCVGRACWLALAAVFLAGLGFGVGCGRMYTYIIVYVQVCIKYIHTYVCVCMGSQAE